jgi:hypothetical protein
VWDARLKAADLASGIECKYRWPRRNSGSILLVQVRCAELCQNPSDWGLGRSVLSERQIPQVIVFSRKSSEKGERKDRAFVRPRQVRYQAALRPDIYSSTDSKLLPRTGCYEAPYGSLRLLRFASKPRQNCIKTH